MLSHTPSPSICLRCASNISKAKSNPSRSFGTSSTRPLKPRPHLIRKLVDPEADVRRQISSTPSSRNRHTPQQEQTTNWTPLLEFQKARQAAAAATVKAKEQRRTEESHDEVVLRDIKSQLEINPEKLKQPISRDPLEDAAIRARTQFGDELPEDHLTDEELVVYKRLFGRPRIIKEVKEVREGEVVEQEVEEELQRETEDGWQAIAEPVEENNPWKRNAQEEEALNEEYIKAEENDQLEEEDVEDPAAVWQEDTEYVRTHPLTLAGRWGTSPSTIQLSKDAFTEPVISLLARTNPKHLATAAETTFGGLGLPYSPSTPGRSKTMEQKPIPLTVKMTTMEHMEADTFMVAVMPQTYAALTGVLVEVRKRLGSEWLRSLMEKEGGPIVMDVSGGGAGILAWREIVKAEWNAMTDKQKATMSSFDETLKIPELSPGADASAPHIPYGKGTVITSSNTLRRRVSKLLDSTSFIPRLPDLVPEELLEDAAPRKQYDVIIAPHSIWPISNEWERQSFVQNLWSLLNPNGGLLILLEKGVPRGFEVVAHARKYLLDNHIQNPPSQALPEEISEEPDAQAVENSKDASDGIKASPGQNNIEIKRPITKDVGMIVAPCTNHVGCPLYRAPGIGQGRKDWCRFSQRYIRPPFLQQVLGAKRRNHDDVDFSYLAVRRGVDLRHAPADSTHTSRVQIQQNEASTDRAFLGYGRDDVLQDKIDLETEQAHAGALGIFQEAESQPEPTTQPQSKTEEALLQSRDPSFLQDQSFDPLMAPRILLTPIKRKGHILIDLCTPMGTFERWLVSRRTGRHAFRDARKSKWGDLWALGAWSREMRRVNLGKVGRRIDGKGKRKAVRVKVNVGQMEHEREREEKEEEDD